MFNEFRRQSSIMLENAGYDVKKWYKVRRLSRCRRFDRKLEHVAIRDLVGDTYTENYLFKGLS